MRGIRSTLWTWGRRVVLVSAPAITLSAIAEEIGDREPLRFDSWLLAGHFHIEPIVVTLAVFSLIGGGAGLILLSAIGSGVLAARRRYRAAMFVVASVIGAELLDRIFKQVFVRARPPVVEYQFTTGMRIALFGVVGMAAASLWRTEWRKVVVVSAAMFLGLLALDGLVSSGVHLNAGNDSFPSGHAVGSMAFIAAMIRLAWPTRHRWTAVVGGTVFVALVGLSRVYLGYHYLSDVAAGWCLSLVWVMLLGFAFGTKLDRPQSDLPDSPYTGALV